MSQSDFGTINASTKSGSALASDLNAFRTALNSCHSGSTRPTYAIAKTIWVNDAINPWIVNIFDGTNDVAIGTINTTTHVFTASLSANMPYSGLTGTVPTWNQNTTGTAANLSGTPTVPDGTAAATQLTSDNSTKLANTAFVKSVAVALTGDQTIAGNKTFSSAVTIPVGTAPNHATSLYQSVYLGQTRQDVTASRVLGTTYTNTGSKPITVLFWTTGMAANAQCNLLVNGLLMQTVYIGNSLASMQFCVQGVVLPGETYSIATGVPKTKWYEIS